MAQSTAPPAISSASAVGVDGRDRPSMAAATTPASMRATPTPTMMGRVGTADTSTKPVMNEPTMAPVVPIAE